MVRSNHNETRSVNQSFFSRGWSAVTDGAFYGLTSVAVQQCCGTAGTSLLLLFQILCAWYVAYPQHSISAEVTKSEYVVPMLITASMYHVKDRIPKLSRVLLWATVAGAIYRSLSKVLISITFPAVILTKFNKPALLMREEARRIEILQSKGKQVERISVPSYDGTNLYAVVVRQPTPTNRWMLYCGGNAEFAEFSLSEGDETANSLRANVVYYNARGVGRSGSYPSHTQDLVLDAAAVAKYVMEREGVEEKNMLLLGHSIGGGVAAQVAAHQCPGCPLVLDRTFSSLSDAAAHFSPLPPSFTSFLITYCIGSLDVVKAAAQLPLDHVLILYSTSDEVISFASASLARLAMFQPGGLRADQVIRLTGDRVQSRHNSPLSDFDERELVFKKMSALYSEGRRLGTE